MLMVAVMNRFCTLWREPKTIVLFVVRRLLVKKVVQDVQLVPGRYVLCNIDCK